MFILIVVVLQISNVTLNPSSPVSLQGVLRISPDSDTAVTLINVRIEDILVCILRY